MGGGDSCSSEDTYPFPSHSGMPLSVVVRPSPPFIPSPPPPETCLSLPSAFPCHHSRPPPGHGHKRHHHNHARSDHKHKLKLKCKDKFMHHHHRKSPHSPRHKHHRSHHSPHHQHITEEVFGLSHHQHHAAFSGHAPPPHHRFFSHPISTTSHGGF